MRQAGRYLPSYQALRKRHALSKMFFTPELAAKVTLLPIDEIGVDAAILFSDITTIVKALGFFLDFQDGVGPVIWPLIEEPTQIDRIEECSVLELECVREAIQKVRKSWKGPLIGFCGGPFTVASYLIERTHKADLALTKKWLYRDAGSFHRLLHKLTEATLVYLDLQIDAGVDVIQIFDSWAHVLSLPDLKLFCLPYHERLIRHVQSRGIPVISFLRSSTMHPHEIAQMKPDAISFDWQRPLSSMRKAIGSGIAIQGNLDPDLLFAPHATIEKETRALLTSMGPDPAFIVNLGHGIKPDTPWQAVRHLVEVVKKTQ
jgi:uroporphyrinogen decarboxylase